MIKIFKYHSINKNLLNSLVKKEHWFCPAHKLNDPYELFFIDKTGNNPFHEIAKQISVCCFSKNMSEILMWSHYADHHKGVCLEFEVDEKIYRTRFFEMLYENAPTILEKLDYHQDGTLSLNINTNGRFIRTKFETWKYEEELRLIMVNDDETINGQSAPYIGDLKAIYFGERATYDDINLVKFNSEKNPNLKFFSVGLNHDTMKMEVRDSI